jgi:hypothetical protein
MQQRRCEFMNIARPPRRGKVMDQFVFISTGAGMKTFAKSLKLVGKALIYFLVIGLFAGCTTGRIFQSASETKYRGFADNCSRYHVALESTRPVGGYQLRSLEFTDQGFLWESLQERCLLLNVQSHLDAGGMKSSLSMFTAGSTMLLAVMKTW